MSLSVIGGILRHVLTTAGGALLVSPGLLTGSELEQAIGAGFTLFGTIWSVLQKRKAAQEATATQNRGGF